MADKIVNPWNIQDYSSYSVVTSNMPSATVTVKTCGRLCFVHIGLAQFSSSGDARPIIQNLPKAAISVQNTLNTSNRATGSLIYIDANTTEVRAHIDNTAAQNHWASLVYLMA